MAKHRILLVLAGAAVLFYSPALLPGRVLLPLDVLCWQLPWSSTPACRDVKPVNPVLSDQVLQFYPWHEVIRRGGWRAALWNPYAYAGSPMLANGQAAPLYPLTWLHFILPATWSYGLAAILRTSIAAVFTFLFARRTQSEEAALLAAIAYAFSYTFVFAVGYPIGDAIMWLPPLLWAVAEHRYGWLALFTALELSAGQPESSVIVAGIVGVWWIAQRPKTREIVKGAGAVAAGLVLALPALIPLLRYVEAGAAGKVRDEYNPLFYSAHTLLEFLTPEFFGTSTPTKSWGSNSGGFYGLLPVLLAAAWIFARPRRALRNPFLWILAASLACIYRVPPFAWLLTLPYLRTIFISKAWLAVTFAGAMLAAQALDDYREQRFRIWWTAAVTVICAAAAAWTFRAFFVEAGFAVKLGASLAATLVALRWSPGFFRYLPAAVVFAELSLYFFNYNPAIRRELLFPSTPGIDFLQRDPERFRIMGDSVLPASTAGVFGLEDVRGYDAITYLPYCSYMSRIDPSFLDFAAHFDLKPHPITRGTLFERDRFERPLRIWGRGFTDFLHHAYYWNEHLERVDNPRLFDLLNVKYFLVAHGARLPPGLDGQVLAYSGPDMDVYRNPHVLPRVSVDGDGTRARILTYLPTEVTVAARGPGLLVLSDTFYPGWTAEGLVIEPVEVLLRGVRLPPGETTVRFVFRAWR